MYRHEMRELKAKKDEDNRLKGIKESVTHIYRNAIMHAETKSEPSYTFHANEFQCNNIQDILSGLQGLFPDCTVKYAKMCNGNHGEQYDILTIDVKILPFLKNKPAFPCILIDWS